MTCMCGCGCVGRGLIAIRHFGGKFLFEAAYQPKTLTETFKHSLLFPTNPSKQLSHTRFTCYHLKIVHCHTVCGYKLTCFTVDYGEFPQALPSHFQTFLYDAAPCCWILVEFGELTRGLDTTLS